MLSRYDIGLPFAADEGGLDRRAQAEGLHPAVPGRGRRRHRGEAGQPGRHISHLFWHRRPVSPRTLRRQVGLLNYNWKKR